MTSQRGRRVNVPLPSTVVTSEVPVENIFELLHAITSRIRREEREAWFAENLPQTFAHVALNHSLTLVGWSE